ncbi:GreA/GreB family elongation factor [Stackebrandtia nassauensis]|uniref:GreA/GreB family elongation factor n=1 Tax=Stackebrandtia nassauensis (strain DSM 44728 / CIP 108903 / NRRL B-16338 / NBRC 102104 / LLR-40K-21) TaxID=446470 RepID=D3Q7E8_STANL|nr:GreA/GreB family elongation factor [Stackebrandtia nassauensis]ADD42419.1 GreA/GreB family elongation factor [Stackebrandtia nassauensis DSM 44728]
MAGKSAPIGANARHTLEQDLAEVRAERDRVAATLTDTDTTGDSADQAQELQRVTDLQLLDARVEKLTARLDASATATQGRTDLVDVGSTVTIRFSDDTTETLHIGEIADVDDQLLVTAGSPLGRALLGHRAGDTVSYNTPSGHATAVVESLG